MPVHWRGTIAWLSQGGSTGFTEKSVSENALKKHLAKLKKRQPYGYLCEMGSQALQDVVERLYRITSDFLMPRRTGKMRASRLQKST